MRHRNTKKILGRDKAHRRSLKRNFERSFFTYEKIRTTEAKAKAMKPLIEKLITIGKTDSLKARRDIIKKVGLNTIATKIIKDISPRYKDRKGGYTRIIKIGTRSGDNAPEVYLMLV